MLVNELLLITKYMYKDFLIQIKDYPSGHLLVQSQQKKARTGLTVLTYAES